MKTSANRKTMTQKSKGQESKEDNVQQKESFANKQSADELNAVVKIPGIIDRRKKKNHDLI